MRAVVHLGCLVGRSSEERGRQGGGERQAPEAGMSVTTASLLAIPPVGEWVLGAVLRWPVWTFSLVLWVYIAVVAMALSVRGFRAERKFPDQVPSSQHLEVVDEDVLGQHFFVPSASEAWDEIVAVASVEGAFSDGHTWSHPLISQAIDRVTPAGNEGSIGRSRFTAAYEALRQARLLACIAEYPTTTGKR